MQKPECTLIRIRGDKNYDLNVEKFIKSLELRYNIYFRTLPKWEELIKRLYAPQTILKRHIHLANQQKKAIINRLYTQNKPVLSQQKVGQKGRLKEERESKISRVSTPGAQIMPEIQQESLVPSEYLEEEEQDFEKQHPNSENPTFIMDTETSRKVNVSSRFDIDSMDDGGILPAFISMNPHKLITISAEDHISQLSYKSVSNSQVKELFLEEWLPTTSVTCNPPKICIENNTLKQQSLIFSLTNFTGEFVHVKFQHFIDSTPFKKAKILPAIPKRVYPGIAVVFKFIFRLKNQEAFQSGLYFKIGHEVHIDAPTESLTVPIVTKYDIERIVKVPNTITIPPVYSWQINMKSTLGDYWCFPAGFLKLSVNDPCSYHLHIKKRAVDLSSECVINYSVKLSQTSAGAQANLDELDSFKNTFASRSKVTTQSRVTPQSQTDILTEIENVAEETVSINTETMISEILEDVLELALDVFVFNSTYNYLQPYSKLTIPVYLTKAEHIGYHQNYYDVILTDPKTEAVILDKTIQVFAEVLPHPVQVTPILLDMSESPVLHGFYEDQFIVYNNHKLYPVTIHVKTTTKMKKLFSVSPMVTVVPTLSSMVFKVKFCSREYATREPCEDYVHFTIKIIVVGSKAIYENASPIFYEIIAPCALVFKKIYNEKYFKDESDI